MMIKTAETADSDSGLLAQFDFEFLPPFPGCPLPSASLSSLPVFQCDENSLHATRDGRRTRGQCHVFIFEIERSDDDDDDGDGKSFIESPPTKEK